MLVRTVGMAVIGILFAAGCTSTGASVSASDSLTPTPSASPSTTTGLSTSPTPTSTPGPSVSETADPVITAGPSTVAGEFAFGISDFGGIPYGQPYDSYVPALGPTVHQAACGDENFPSVYPGSPAASWELFLIVPWDDPNLAWLDWDTKAFLLTVPSDTLPTTQIGPVGPRGLRLGTPEATIEAMFPPEAASSTTRTTHVPLFNGTTAVIDERVFTITDLDGGPMIITTVDGYVATMMWGDPAYVTVQRGFLRCTS